MGSSKGNATDMARIVLGIGTSHGPMLSIPPEYWKDRVAADRAETKHPFRGGTYTFDNLAALRRNAGRNKPWPGAISPAS